MNMKKNAFLPRLAALTLVCGALSVAVLATAAPPVPDMITHQGRLYSIEGMPITGQREMRFAIYDTPTPAANQQPLWSATKTVTFDEGYYAEVLGDAANPLVDGGGNNLLLTSPLYLQIAVGDQGGQFEAFPELALLGSVPYARVCDDVRGDIHPTSVTMRDPVTENEVEVIDSTGEWIGPPVGVVSVTTASGAGLNPSSTLNFIGPTVTVALGTNQAIFVSSSKAVGSIAAGGGVGLTINICYRPMGGAITTAGMGLNNLRVPNGTRISQSLSGLIEQSAMIPAGTYEVGLCGMSSNFTSWSDNDLGTTTAIVYKKPAP
jgi:hypothetical protein